ncbi:hypothetical protein DLM78_19350 [Leptospira stimsonii]|uniref:Uncharacterized protein n=1 Tax=Leptospira stimsonii TaxID=2202203 RepID=A0A8B3CNG6_9LEPT|nr:hypothetical protein DLM78_19350 [Leptospira stimsonii]
MSRRCGIASQPLLGLRQIPLCHSSCKASLAPSPSDTRNFDNYASLSAMPRPFLYSACRPWQALS